MKVIELLARHTQGATFGHWHKYTHFVPGPDLSWTRNLLFCVIQHLLPLRQPPHRARNGKQHSKHFWRKSHGLIDDSRVKVYVRVQFAFDKVIVLKRDTLQFKRDVQLRVAASYLEHLLGGPL